MVNALQHHSMEELLRGVGLRVTAPRLAVLHVLESRPHAESSAIVAAVAADHPAVSRQAVFDCLNAFAEAGLVRRIQPAGSAARYELRVGDNHHHLVCRECGAVTDVDCAVGPAPCLEAPSDQGFIVDEAEVIYWGRCAACASAIPETV